MVKFYVTLEIEAENLHDADKVAEGISDSAGAPIAGVFPGFDVQQDNEGQVVVYTDYFPHVGA